LARFVTIDEDVLQKTNVMKLLPRIMKKGGKQVKELAQIILDNAAASTKRKEEAAKTTAATTATSSSSKEDSPYKDATTPEEADDSQSDPPATKRPREAESNGLPTSKRVATPQNVKNAVSISKTGNGTASSSKREMSVEAKTVVSTPNAAVTMARPKANIIAPKPTSLFGSLTSASKKPGTSNAARAAAAAAAAAAAKEKPMYVY
jgi:hypothetical protein